jgi:hypothetical protein
MRRMLFAKNMLISSILSLENGYLQALWDQIAEDPGTLPVPENHLRLAEERLKRYRQDPVRAHSAFEVLDRLADTSSANSESE